MTPQRLREWVLVFIRDLAIPGTGIYLAIYLPTHNLFEPWQLPLIAGLCGVPLVARGERDDPDDD